MYDINFFKQVEPLKKRIVAGELNKADAKDIAKILDASKSKKPFVFNIETTNNCNMSCVMCPRTELMTRKVRTMGRSDFNKILEQVTPHTDQQLKEFESFIDSEYGLAANVQNENSFYFSVVAKCLTLHGYGEPLLDKYLLNRIEDAYQKGIPTYLSCVPANLTLEKAELLFRAGLTVLKVSIDALTDFEQKEIRGEQNNFQASYRTILEILKMKSRDGFKTMVVPTMIDFSNSDEAASRHEKFLELWKGLDVFAYVKSQDNRWLYEQDEELENKSHYEKQYCEFPWTSLSISVEGDIIPCTQDYNTEMSFGDTRTQSLEEIWNGESYRDFRDWHTYGNFPPGHKCIERCDQKKLFQVLEKSGHGE